MEIGFFQLFTDPIFRAPMIGSLLISLAMGVVGVILFIRRRLLIGEALSHAVYPGIVVSAMVAALFFSFPGEDEGLFVLVGAFLSALAGLFFLDFLERKMRMYSDAALCFMLSLFFGVGVLLVSRIQLTHAAWYKQVQVFLYGQAATLDDRHLLPLGILSIVCIVVVALLYRLIQWASFDRQYIQGRGGKVKVLDALLNLLLLLSLSIGMRTVGVVLLAGMLIAPAVAARFWTKHLSSFFILSGLFGLVSGGIGNYLSINLPLWMGLPQFALPTGPTILLTASVLAFVSMLCAPKKGLFRRTIRFISFRYQIQKENLLKQLWKAGEEKSWGYTKLVSFIPASAWLRFYLFCHLRVQGWIEKKGKKYGLTTDGARRAARIVRLHRLWEVYLVECLGQQKEKAHHNAEEMEHIITPELERELTRILKDPDQDPHHQPIPKV